MRLYHHATGCWEYTRTPAGIRLHKLAAAHPPRKAPPPPRETASTNGTPHPPTNGKARTLDDLVLHVPGGDLAANEPLVTEEELAMLLGSGAGDAGR